MVQAYALNIHNLALGSKQPTTTRQKQNKKPKSSIERFSQSQISAKQLLSCDKTDKLFYYLFIIIITIFYLS